MKQENKRTTESRYLLNEREKNSNNSIKMQFNSSIQRKKHGTQKEVTPNMPILGNSWVFVSTVMRLHVPVYHPHSSHIWQRTSALMAVSITI
jgi:hypothetical protein